MVKDSNCLILEYYHFLGKKWSYPFLFHMTEGKSYTFEELIHVTNRKVSRSVLLKFLAKAIELSIIEKASQGYCLSSLGSELKDMFLNTKDILVKYHPQFCKNCISASLINKNRI